MRLEITDAEPSFEPNNDTLPIHVGTPVHLTESLGWAFAVSARAGRARPQNLLLAGTSFLISGALEYRRVSSKHRVTAGRVSVNTD